MARNKPDFECAPPGTMRELADTRLVLDAVLKVFGAIVEISNKSRKSRDGKTYPPSVKPARKAAK